MENKTTKLETSADGIFMHSSNPSPVMQAAMDSIRRQMQAEAEHRKAVRECREADNGIEFPSWGPALGQWGNWNISDRD